MKIDEEDWGISCRVEIESVSLALLVHLWTGVCAIDVPDKPGAVAYTREATRIMRYPYGCPPLRTLPSFQAGHCWGKRQAAWSPAALQSH